MHNYYRDSRRTASVLDRFRGLTRREWGVALGFVVVVNAVGALPAAFFGAETDRIDRPWFFPPDVLFPIAWTLLFSLIAVALFIVWRHGTERRAVRVAILAFCLQFALNVAWTPVFFGLQRPDAGLVVIGALWVAIVGTIVAFARVSRLAARLLVPYLAWVTFALVLNYAIYAGVG